VLAGRRFVRVNSRRHFLQTLSLLHLCASLDSSPGTRTRLVQNNNWMSCWLSGSSAGTLEWEQVMMGFEPNNRHCSVAHKKALCPVDVPNMSVECGVVWDLPCPLLPSCSLVFFAHSRHIGLLLLLSVIESLLCCLQCHLVSCRVI